MKRFIIFALVFLLALSFVSAVPSLGVSPTSLTILGPENSQRSISFTVTNTGDSILNNIVFSNNIQLSDGTNTMTLSFNPTSIASLNIGAAQPVTLTANIPDNMKLGSYSGTVNASSGTVQSSFSLNIIVTPEICTDGPQGNEIGLEIEDPNDGDSFKPGEKIELSVNVENKKSSDETFLVKAYLYNMDSRKKIASIDSDEQEISGDEDSTFDFSLDIPTDTKYLKDGEDYMLFVKALEKGEEDNSCQEGYTNLELELEDEKAVIESVVFSPTEASCGDSVTAAVKVRNIGNDDLNDVRVEIKNDNLKINKLSSFFDLSNYDDYSDSDYLAQITFDIPAEIEDNDYEFTEINVLYSGESSSTELLSSIPKLIISGCNSLLIAPTNVVAQADLAITPSQTSVAVGSSLILNYALTNPTNNEVTYIIEFVPQTGNWANTVSQTAIIGAGQTYTGALTTLTNDVVQGAYSGMVFVKSGTVTLTQKPVNMELLNPNQITGGVTYTKKSLWDNLKMGNIPVAFWVIADLILAFVILALVYIVYRR